MLAVGGHILGDLDSLIVKMTNGFAGGVGGSRQEMCGALSTGVMIIGALHGRSSLEEDDLPAQRLAARYRPRRIRVMRRRGRARRTNPAGAAS